MTSLDAVRGRINDVDSHEMIPPSLWHDNFGEAAGMLAALLPQGDDLFALGLNVHGDEQPITDETVWQRAGCAGPGAPGAIDMHRRLKVLDCMQVKRQLIFPTVGTFGIMLQNSGADFLKSVFTSNELAASFEPEVVREAGRALVRGYNDWVIENIHVDPDRLRLVPIIPTEDLGEMLAETERMLAAGVRALFLPASMPPGGKSPADRAVAPFWSLCEESGTSVQLHLAFETLFATDVWRKVPEFELEASTSAEFVVDPWSFAMARTPMETYLTTMILGGVFERHPRLRFGVIECGSQWVGPLAENLNMWAGVFSRRMAKVLSMRPSEYLRRNVRVTPFLFEPIDVFIERYAEYSLEDVFCYGSDYPHAEGGTDQLTKFAEILTPLGPDVLEKFFVTNAELLVS